MNRCQFSKFKFIKCGLAEIFLVKELDRMQDFVWYRKDIVVHAVFQLELCCVMKFIIFSPTIFS